jgi:hypothetical protein
MKKIFPLVALACLCVKNGYTQNIGIGTNTPVSKLHIKGTGTLLRLDAPAPSISFFNESTNLGSLFMNETDGSMNFHTPLFSGGSIRFTPNNTFNTIFTSTGRVGIGTTTPVEKLDISGNINLTGVLKFNGSAGTAGQVLMSNGTSAPEWVNAPYSNTTRFAAEIPTTVESDDLTYTSIYNLNTNDVSISSSNGLVISKSGLYHFEGYITAVLEYDVAPPADHGFSLGLSADGVQYEIVRLAQMHSVGTYQYNLTVKFSNDIYITAPGNVVLFRSFLHNRGIGGAGVYIGRRVMGKISGYLISE